MEKDGVAYPSDDWTDFGVVIVGWWFVQARRLLKGAITADFSFMDGPYSLDAKKHDDLLTLTSTDGKIIWELTLKDFCTSLSEAIKAIALQLLRLQIADYDLSVLLQSSDELKKLIEEL